MDAERFRRIVLAMPDAVESAHGGHPDFRVGETIFATLGYPDAKWCVLMLKPDQQALLVGAEPAIFRPVKGAWGERGSTQANLDALDDATAKNAVRMAWESATSK